MPTNHYQASEDTGLRARAEAALSKESQADSDLPQLSLEELRRLVHELSVHQMELDLQNEELRRTRIEVEESRDRYTELYDFAPVGYLTLTDKGLIEESNLMASQLLGATRDTLVNRPLSKYVREEDIKSYYLFLKRLFAQETKQTTDIVMIRKDGAPFHARL
jgi:PAS domain S-box-containing protein